MQNKKHYRRFFFITFLWSWTLLSVPIMLGLSYENSITKILFYAAGMSPSATGIILVCLKRDKEYSRDFWNRTLNLRRISGKWYLIIFAFIPLTSLASVFISYVATNNMHEFFALRHYLRNPVELLMLMIFTFLFGPVAEEIGWRGYALEHLEKSYNWIASSLILGFFWSLWHLPMFFIEGTYQSELLNRSFLLFIDFYAGIFAMSIIMDWVYNNTDRSILSGILLHFCTNFFGELLKLPDNLMYLRTLVQILAAVLILLHYRNSQSTCNRINQNALNKA